MFSNTGVLFFNASRRLRDLPQSLPAGRQVARGFLHRVAQRETGDGVFASRNLSADKGRLVVSWLYVVAFGDEKTKRIITELHRGLGREDQKWLSFLVSGVEFLGWFEFFW